MAKMIIRAHGIEWEMKTDDPYATMKQIAETLSKGPYIGVTPGRMVILPSDSAVEFIGDDIDPVAWAAAGQLTGYDKLDELALERFARENS
jgi:hypothetical protein